MDDKYEFMERVNGALTAAWVSEGGVSINARQCGDHWHVMLCPALREINGGKDDGGVFFASYDVDVNEFMRLVFDKGSRRKINFSSSNPVPQFWCKGKVLGETVDFTFLSEPPPGQKPAEVQYMIGPKSGRIEPVHCHQDDQDDEDDD